MVLLHDLSKSKLHYGTHLDCRLVACFFTRVFEKSARIGQGVGLRVLLTIMPLLNFDFKGLLAIMR